MPVSVTCILGSQYSASECHLYSGGVSTVTVSVTCILGSQYSACECHLYCGESVQCL